MYISIKNSKNFPKDDIAEISRYLISSKFAEQLSLDCQNKYDEYTRKIVKISDYLFIIRHTEFSPPLNIEELHVVSSEKYGLLDLYYISTDANRGSILYWVVRCNSKYVLNTEMGLIAKNTDTLTDTPKVLGRFDHLWFSSTKNSSVLAIDKGSSHLVT